MPVLRRRSAFTIIEMLVAMVILSLLLTSIYLVMQPGLRQFALGNVFSGIQQESQKAMQILVKDFSFAHVNQVAVGGGTNPYVWFLSPETPAGATNPFEFSNGGQMVWQKWVCYYLDPTEKLLVKVEAPLTPPTEVVVPAPAPAPALASFMLVSGAGRKIVAHSARTFAVTKLTNTNYQVQFSAREDFGADKTEVTLVSEVTVRNQ